MSWNPLTWIPFSRAGRQTLVYLALAGCGPALTAVIVWAMHIVETFPGTEAAQRLDKFSQLAMLVGAALLIIVIALSSFVSIRAIKIGRDGIEEQGAPGGDDGGA